MGSKKTDKEHSMLYEVLQGLREPQKSLPSKYFYDKRGSRLFEQITELKEYYLTRTELSIMQNNLPEMTQYIGENAVLVEPGSGNSEKTQILLNELPGLSGYVPVDISRKYLVNTVQNLKEKYPDMSIKPVCADYTKTFRIPAFEDSDVNYVVFYPGSTIGNFHPTEAGQFLNSISQILNPEGGVLVGVDLQKDKKTLEAAYNDEQGITATFNKNILRHINRKLNADFKPNHFEHRAFYNKKESRIEMHLMSDIGQMVTVGEEQIHFEKGETIHTENSYKYTLDGFDKLVSPRFLYKRSGQMKKLLFNSIPKKQ